MTYLVLTPQQQTDLMRQKLLEVEAEHFKLHTDLRLASISGIDNNMIDEARGQLAVLEIQATALAEWLGLNDRTEEEPADA